MADFVILPISNTDDDDIIPIVESLKLKERTLIICDNPILEEKKLPNLIIDSFKDVPSLIRKIFAWKEKNNATFRCIVQLDEEFHYRVTEAVAKALELDCFDRHTADLASNKYLQKQALDKSYLCNPSYRIIKSVRDAIGFNFPCVLKIITGYGSSFVFLNKTNEDIKRSIAKIQDSNSEDSCNYMFVPHETPKASFDSRTQFILEDYIPGNEYSCDFMVTDGPTKVIRLVRKFSSSFGFFDAFLLFNPDIESNVEFSLVKLAAFCQKVASAMGFSRGVCMLDFKFCKGEFYVIETTIRPGISTFVDLMKSVYGWTTIDKLIDYKLGNILDFSIPVQSGMVVYLTTRKRGVLKGISTESLSDSGLHIVKISLFYKPGHVIEDNAYNNFSSMLGYVLVQDTPFQDADSILSRVKKGVKIDVEPKP